VKARVASPAQIGGPVWQPKDSIRAFLACPLSETIIIAARRVQEQAVSTGVPLRLVSPESLHLTLAFLGHVEPDRLDYLLPSLQRDLSEIPPTRQGVSAVTVLPERGPARVVCLVLAGDAGLQKVHTVTQSHVTRSGIAVDRRPFLPHVTVARVARTAREVEHRALRQTSESLRVPRQLPSLLDRVVLYQSDLLPGGPKYSILGSCQLRGEELV